MESREKKQPRERANSLPDNAIRKVTIQQTIVQPANTFVARPEYPDNVRQFAKVEYHDPTGRGHRGKHSVKATRGVVLKHVNGLETGEKNIWETTSRTGERELWEKAVRELELVIAEKDTAIENLSKVNRKLSEEVEYCEKSLQDSRDRLRIIESELKQATEDNKEQAWYERTLRDREGKRKELEEKLKGIVKCDETRDTRSLELSQGAKSVLKNLELRKEKNKLEKKVEELEKQLKTQTSTPRKETPALTTREETPRVSSHDNNPKQTHEKIFEGIISSLRKFQLTMEKSLRERMDMVTDMHSRLATCLVKCKNVSEKVGKTSEKFGFESAKVGKTSDEVGQESEKVGKTSEKFGFKSAKVGKTSDEVGQESENVGHKSGDVEQTSSQGGVRVEEIISQQSSLQVSCQPGSDVGDYNPGEPDLGDETPGVSNLQDVNQGYLYPGYLTPEEVMDYEEEIESLNDTLMKERKINDEIIERFLELEEANKGYESTVEGLRGKANLTDNLRAQNESLAREISEIRENVVQRKTSLAQDNVGDTDEREELQEQKGIEGDTVRIYEEQLSSLRQLLESKENEMKELREKIGEDDELIEEIRANFQREEKWNREIQRKFEWELSSSASKDDRIDEFQDCLWAREKTVRQLREQLEFEDKRCEELLEKLVASQSEAQEFEEIAQNLQRKIEDKEKCITEFCEQNDRDAIVIGNLSSENKRLRMEAESITKARKELEEDLERLSSSLETIEEKKETFLKKQKNDVKQLSIQLEEEEFTSKGKDEVIEKLQENLVLLSADVKEMESRMEEGRETQEEELRKAKDAIEEREKDLKEALGRYNELEEVCKSLREKNSQKEEQIVEREADIASQRETIEENEKQIEELREKSGDNSTRLNKRPALVYTEGEMEEINEFLEQEREISETFRMQVEFLENEVKNYKDSFLEMKTKLEIENETQKTELISTREELHAGNKTREELHARSKLLEKTREELHAGNTFLEKTREELHARDELLERTREELHAGNMLLEKTREELHARDELLERTREELHAQNTLLEKTREESHAMNIDLLKQKETLISKEKELDGCKANLKELQMKVNNLNKEKKILETNVLSNKRKLILAKEETQELNEKLKKEMRRMEEEVKRGGDRNEELKSEVKKLTAKSLERDEELRRAHVTNVNLRYSLEECISQSREQISNLRNHEQEVDTLRRHLEEMNVLINAFRNEFEEAVRKESLNPDESSKEVNLKSSLTNSNDSELQKVSNGQEDTKVSSGHPVSTVDTLGTSGINEDTKVSSGHPVSTVDTLGTSGINEDTKVSSGHSASTVDTLGTSGIHKNMRETVFPLNSRDSTDGTEEQNKRHPGQTLSPGCHNNNDVSHTEIVTPAAASQNKQSSLSFLQNLNQKSSTFLKNRSLVFVFGFLVFVFVFGCLTNSIVSRKYLFVFANSIMSLTMFVLWRDEVRKNKHLNGLSSIQSTLGENSVGKFQGNGYVQNKEVAPECEHCGNNITSSREELLHFGKIKSSFHELHEKFLEAVENSSKDTLPIQELYNEYEKLKEEVETMRIDRLDKDALLTPTSEESDSMKESLLAIRWNKVTLILARMLIIVALCELLYIRGSYLPELLRPLLFWITSFLLSYCFDTMWVDSKNAETHVEENAVESAREIDELNEIIDKEHELVLKQREAIKALEKRLRKEFERRIKQRNALLKKLKYKGKLEDLRELLEDEDSEEKEGHNKSKEDFTKNQIKSDSLRKLRDIFTKTEQQSHVLDLTFSPMFFFLGIPLTGIMLSCGYVALAVLMVVLQVTMLIKESKFIEVEKLPDVFQKEIHPIIMDTIVVLYACLLAVCLQCSQGIVVLVTCSVVQLGVHWWTCYKLAKREDTLYEISKKCLPSTQEKTF